MRSSFYALLFFLPIKIAPNPKTIIAATPIPAIQPPLAGPGVSGVGVGEGVALGCGVRVAAGMGVTVLSMTGGGASVYVGGSVMSERIGVSVAVGVLGSVRSAYQ